MRGTAHRVTGNSQRFQNTLVSIALSPRVFSPDGDGADDDAKLSYTLPESGWVANLFVYDATGRKVRHLAKNAVLGTSGTFAWNGLDDTGRRLPAGHYIFYTELFTLEGKKQPYKNVVVLARRLN
jgi:flagellar hook assembly protein FlgD